MDTQMKLDASLIKALREEKSWSQEHLANAAGLSTRTVQRVEADGVGSLETRLALAAALDVSVSKLAATGDVAALSSSGYRHGQRWGWIGWSVGAVGAFAGITNSVFTGSSSTAQTGIAIGVVCAGLGISAGVMGYLNFRVRNPGVAV